MIAWLVNAYAYAIVLILAGTLLYALCRYFCAALRKPFPFKLFHTAISCRVPKNLNAKADPLRVLFCVLLAFALSRAALWLTAWVISLAVKPEPMFVYDWNYLATQWDAAHYLGIAQNGYVTEGDARLHLVFYPLYPLLVRGISFLTGGNLLLSALIVSNTCLIASGYVLYRLVELNASSRSAMRSMWLFMFCPAGMFFSIAYTESLFFLLTVLSVYAARRKKWLLSLSAGALSALTRLPGIICATAVFFERLRNDFRKDRRPARPTVTFFKNVFICCAPLLGFGVYLLVNLYVAGDPFRFLTYQSEHWGQKFGSTLYTALYTLTYAIEPNVDWYQQGVWIPQTAFLLLTAAILFAARKHMHPGDLAYALVYFIVVTSPTSLLSGPRYLCAMYALYPALSSLCEKRFSRFIVYSLYGCLFVYCAWISLGKTILL